MDIEALQREWQRLDEKLNRSLRLEGELLQMAIAQPARRRIHRLAIWPALDVALGLVVLLFAGSVLGNHWQVWSIVIPSIVAMAATIALAGDSIRQLVHISQINWDGTLVDIQSSLSRLRIVKIRQFKWIILLSPLIGFCGLIVSLQWLLDWLPEQHLISEKLNPTWVAANYVFGVLFMPFGQAIVRILAKQFGRRSWWQEVLDGISGTSMTKARDELDRWATLNREAMDINAM